MNGKNYRRKRRLKLSIVIPNLNSGEYLEKCLDSIFSQSYTNFEIILIDGYSSDDSKKTIKKYSNNKHLTIGYKSPQGQSDAINTGMSIATGDIVTYICADDTYEPNCFKRVAKAFTKPSVMWIYGKGNIIDDRDKEIRGFITNSKRLLQPRYSYHTLQCVDYIVQPTVFIRKEFFKQIGEFNTTLKYVMDYEYWLRAGQVSSPKFINKHLANWRAHSGSLTEREHKAEAKQAMLVQSWYSPWYYRPIQWLVYIVTVTLYGSWMRK